jgi:hypothetical protein
MHNIDTQPWILDHRLTGMSELTSELRFSLVA